MTEILVWFAFYCDVAIKFLIVLLLITWIVSVIYAMKIDKTKKKEVKRLKTLNDGLENLYKTPIQKAREFLKTSEENKKVEIFFKKNKK